MIGYRRGGGSGDAGSLHGNRDGDGWTARAHPSSDGVLDHALALPKELGGPGCAATNPEQLFAAGYAACFENALLRVARERKAPIRESAVIANVGIGREKDGYFRLVVDLEVSVPDRDRAAVEELARIAHEEVCPYSRATRGNIDVNHYGCAGMLGDASRSCLAEMDPGFRLGDDGGGVGLSMQPCLAGHGQLPGRRSSTETPRAPASAR